MNPATFYASFLGRPVESLTAAITSLGTILEGIICIILAIIPGLLISLGELLFDSKSLHETMTGYLFSRGSFNLIAPIRFLGNYTPHTQTDFSNFYGSIEASVKRWL